jgi:hypothetical protein
MSDQPYHLHLKPTDWHQHLSTVAPITKTPAGRVLSTVCRVEPVPVQLTSGERLEDMLVDVTIKPWSTEAEKDSLLRGKMGSVTYLRLRAPEMNPMSIWIWMRPATLFDDIWRQVSDGRYTDCRIEISVGPFERQGPKLIWDLEETGTLYVEYASIRFTHSGSR